MILTHCLYPTLGAIELLSQEERLEDVYTKYTTDFSGQYLIPRNFFLGYWFSVIRPHCEYWGIITRDGGYRILLEKVLSVLQQIKFFALHVDREVDSDTSTYISMCYNPEMGKKLQKVFSIVCPTETFPSLGPILRVVAPKILSGLIAMQEPREALTKLMVDESSLTRRDNAQIKDWIESVTFHGKVITQELLFSFLEYIVQREFSEERDIRRFYAVFGLAWKLYQRGLKAVVDESDLAQVPEKSFESEVIGFENIRPGSRMALAFPFDFPAYAYEIPGRQDVMFVYSSSPLAIGLHLYQAYKEKSLLPLLKIFVVDPKARYCVAEKIAFWISDPQKGSYFQENISMKRKFTSQLASLVHDMIHSNSTLNLPLEQLFFTISGNIASLCPVTQLHDFFSPPVVEKYIRKICNHDQMLIKDILCASHFFGHPFVKAVRNLITEHNFRATEKMVRTSISSFTHDEQTIQKCISWHEELRLHMHHLLPAIENQTVFKGKSPPEILHFLAILLCNLQEKEGFFMHAPDKISEKILSRITATC